MNAFEKGSLFLRDLTPFKIVSLWAIMTTINLGKVVDSIERLRSSAPPPQVPIAGMSPWLAPYSVPIQEYEVLKRDVEIVCDAMQSLGMPGLLSRAQKLRKIIFLDPIEKQLDRTNPVIQMTMPVSCETVMEFPLASVNFWRDTIIDLKKLFPEELSTRLAMVLSSAKVSYLDGTRNSLGSAIPDTFLDAEHDMGEAGKCFALGRYTACVFHLMRIMERLVQEFASNVEAEIVRRGARVEIKYAEWHEIEDAIAAKTKDMPRGERKSRCNAALTTLGAIRLGVRNEVMHPRGFYSEEDAERLIDNVKSFVEDVLTLPSA